MLVIHKTRTAITGCSSIQIPYNDTKSEAKNKEYGVSEISVPSGLFCRWSCKKKDMESDLINHYTNIM